MQRCIALMDSADAACQRSGRFCRSLLPRKRWQLLWHRSKKDVMCATGLAARRHTSMQALRLLCEATGCSTAWLLTMLVCM